MRETASPLSTLFTAWRGGGDSLHITRRSLLRSAAFVLAPSSLVACSQPAVPAAPTRVALPRREGRRLLTARQAVEASGPAAARWRPNAGFASVLYPGVLDGDTGTDDSGLQPEWQVRYLALDRRAEDDAALTVYVKDGAVDRAEPGGPSTAPPRPWLTTVPPYDWPIDSDVAFRRALDAGGRRKVDAGLSSLSIAMEYLESDDGDGWPRQAMWGWAVIFRGRGAGYDPGLLIELDGEGRPVRSRDLRSGVVDYFDPYTPILSSAKEAWEFLGLFARGWQPDAALTRFHGRVSARAQPLLPGHVEGRLARWHAEFVSVKARGILKLSGERNALGWAINDEGTTPASEPYLTVNTDRWRIDSTDVAALFAGPGGAWLRAHPQPSRTVQVYLSLGPGEGGAPAWTIRYGDEVTDFVGTTVDAETGAMRAVVGT